MSASSQHHWQTWKWEQNFTDKFITLYDYRILFLQLSFEYKEFQWPKKPPVYEKVKIVPSLSSVYLCSWPSIQSNKILRYLFLNIQN